MAGLSIDLVCRLECKVGVLNYPSKPDDNGSVGTPAASALLTSEGLSQLLLFVLYIQHAETISTATLAWAVIC